MRALTGGSHTIQCSRLLCRYYAALSQNSLISTYIMAKAVIRLLRLILLVGQNKMEVFLVWQSLKSERWHQISNNMLIKEKEV